MKIEEKYMRRCIQLARNGQLEAPPNPMVGAVIVHNGRIIGEGYHVRCGTEHAEVNAIASVKSPELLCESTLYVSLEPCAHYGKTPPCADLIIEKNIPRVVVGCIDPFASVAGRGIAKLKEAGVEVVVGVCEQECLELNKVFFTFHKEKRPYVTLKWAESEDGFIDACRQSQADGEAVHFSSLYTQMLVHKRRVEHQAVCVGRKTVDLDNPQLNARVWPGRSPLRIVVDPRGVLSEKRRVFEGGQATWAYVRTGAEPAYCNAADVACIRLPKEEYRVEKILFDLHEKGIQSVLVEGGAFLLQSFVDAGCWDEAVVEHSALSLSSGVPSPLLSGYEESHTIVWAGRVFKHYRRCSGGKAGQGLFGSF